MDVWPTIDWSKCPAVESRPGAFGGKWVFTGTQVPVYILFANLASGGMTADHFSDAYLVDNEQVKEVLAFLGSQLDRTPREAKQGPATLDGLLAGLTKDDFHEETSWGPPVGREVL